MIRTMKNTLGLLAALLCLGLQNCTETDMKCRVVGKVGPGDDITGSWKLVKGQALFPEEVRTVDYSCHDVVYHFGETGILTVSGSTAENLVDLDFGEYTYELIKAPWLEYLEGSFTLKIEGLNHACWLSSREMTIDSSPLDGPILTLVRL